MELLLKNTLSFTVFITGLTLWIAFLLLKPHIPKNINHYYGYRTSRSKASQESWDFAQKYSVELMLKASKWMMVLALPLYLLNINPTVGTILGTIIVLFILAYVMYLTEQKLKEKF